MLSEDKVKLHDARKVIANIVGQLKQGKEDYEDNDEQLKQFVAKKDKEFAVAKKKADQAKAVEKLVQQAIDEEMVLLKKSVLVSNNA